MKGAPGVTTRSKDATRKKGHRYERSFSTVFGVLATQHCRSGGHLWGTVMGGK